MEETKSVEVINDHFFFGKLLQELPRKTLPTMLDIICKYLYEMFKIAEKYSKARRGGAGNGNSVEFFEEKKHKNRIIKNIRADLILIWTELGIIPIHSELKRGKKCILTGHSGPEN